MTEDEIDEEAFLRERKCNEQKNIELLKALNMSYGDLLVFAARLMCTESFLFEVNEELNALLRQHEMVLDVFADRGRKIAEGTRAALLELVAEANNSTARALIKGIELQKSNQGKKGARAKIERDPKQSEKNLVYECWQKWQKNPDSYRGKAAFARDMLEKCEHLTSQKKIEDWCREWEKATRNHAG